MAKITYLLAGAFCAGLAQAAGAQVADGDRMSRIEAQMRNLTGQIEQLSHSLSELQAQLKRVQDDNEFRFRSLETAAPAGPVTAPKAPTPAVKQPAAAATPVPVPPASASATPATPTAAPAPSNSDAIGALAAAGAPPLPAPGTQGPGAPPKPLGTVTIPAAPSGGAAIAGQPQPGDQQPLDLSALAKGGGVVDGTPLTQPQGPQIPVDQKAVASIAPSGDPQLDYKKAYELFVGGQYAASEAAFRQFLVAYPSDDRASDATYWLGQTLYSRGMYREAALEFVNSHKLYPKSLRAADTMLLLGKSLAGIPEREAACQTFAAALKQYPQMTAQLKQRVVSEQANAGC